MKTNFLPFVLLLTLIFLNLKNVSAQSQVRGPHTGSQQYFGCLACPGSTWDNTQNIITADSLPASTMLSNPPTCFQSDCYFSRGLLGSNFKFTIPSTSIIQGITVSIRRKAGAISSAITQPVPIKDSVVQLLNKLVPVGKNLKANILWPEYYAYRNYGSNINTWGYTWTPAIINDAGFGVLLKCKRLPSAVAANSPFGNAYVDYLRIKVWYVLYGTNRVESEEREVSFNNTPSPLVYPNPANESTVLKITLDENTVVNTEVFDLAGKRIVSSAFNATEGVNELPLSLSNAPAGIYIVKIKAGENSWFSKLVKQ